MYQIKFHKQSYSKIPLKVRGRSSRGGVTVEYTDTVLLPTGESAITSLFNTGSLTMKV